MKVIWLFGLSIIANFKLTTHQVLLKKGYYWKTY